MAVTVSIYDQAREDILNSTLDLDADTLKVALLNNSATFTAANTVFSDVSANELAGGNGYTSGGQALTSAVVSHTGTTAKFTAANLTWNASGGAIGPAYKAVLYDTTVSNKLIAFIDFGGGNTAGDGTAFKINWNASGILTLS